MREYVVLSYIKNSLTFDFKNLNEDERDNVDTNVFYKDSLFYTLRYFKKHIHKITNIFMSDNYDIDWLIVMRIITFKFAVTIMNDLSLCKLRLLFKSTLSLDDYSILLSAESLKEVDCYFMPSFIIKKYNEFNIKVNMYNKNKINSHFMLDQDAFDYDALYYKKEITIKKEYDDLLDDIKELLRINYNLRTVNLYVYSKGLIKEIIELIKNDESKNVVVLLHQSSDKGNFIEKNFAWLKKLNEDCKQELTCEFRIIYSHNYIKNNLFKQLSFNNLKLIAILAIYISASGLIVYKSYEYVEKLNSDKVKTDILNQTANSLDMNEDLSGIDVELGEDLTDKEIKSKYQFDNVMSQLKQVNSETVGFLVVNNTNISYPVVQHSDNSYYLKHDFYQKSTTMGWIYLDYRNNKDSLDSNNIIYGHSMKNETMFGTLKKALSTTWRKDENNMIISYDSTTERYKFVIFSIYKVDYTTDYLKVNFDGEKDFNDFVTVIKKRSIFKSNEIVEYGDKILTLSTCTGSSNQRLVVHAVLMKEGDQNE